MHNNGYPLPWFSALLGFTVIARAQLVDFFWSTPVQVVLWCTALAGLTALGYFIVQRFRGNTDEDKPSTSDLITNFREMHHAGDISDAEYRTIKTMLSTKFQQELKGRGDDA